MAKPVGCPRCARDNDMLVTVIVRWLDNGRSGNYSKSRAVSFCAHCAMDVYEYLRLHLERAQNEKVA